jgi:hypothetical protein
VKEFADADQRLDGAGWPELNEFSLEVDLQTAVDRVRSAFGAWEHLGQAVAPTPTPRRWRGPRARSGGLR